MENDITLPEEFNLLQNYPNPFNPSTKIRLQVPALTYVLLEIYDLIGRRVSTLINREMNAGKYEVEFDGGRFSSGVYIYRLKAGNHISNKKMLLLK